MSVEITVERIDRSNSLADLAARIEAEHKAVAKHLKAGVEHSIAAGRLLIEAKAQFKHGQWLPWLRQNCTMSERTASLYMRLARGADELTAKSASLADLTVEDAVRLLSPAAPLSPFETVAKQVQLINERIVVTPVGMEFPDDLSFEEWLKVGMVLMAFGGAAA
jgi:hypothetical protein